MATTNKGELVGFVLYLRRRYTVDIPVIEQTFWIEFGLINPRFIPSSDKYIILTSKNKVIKL